MKIRTTLAVIALSLAPGFALAAGCDYGAKPVQSVSQCAAGQIWDAATQGCVTAVNS